MTSPIFQASGTFLSYPRLCMWKIYTLLLLLQKKVYIDAPCKIESPVAYFLFSQQPLGGWPRFSIPHTSFADYAILGSLISSIKILSLFWFCVHFGEIKMWSFSTIFVLAGVLAINPDKQVTTAVNEKFGNIYSN